MQTNSGNPKFRLNFPPNFVVFILLFIFFSVSFLSVIQKSATYDEVRNFLYGVSILDGNSNRPGNVSSLDGVRVDGSMMPISALNAIPQKLATSLSEGPVRDILNNGAMARMISIIFSTFVALLVFHWTRSLYGLIPAFFSLLLYIFDPNIIAHSQLITTDMYAWGTTLLVFYCSWRLAKDRTLRNGILWTFALGLSALAKYTTAILIPLSLLAIIISDLPMFLKSYKEQAAVTAKKYTGKYLAYLAGSVIVSIAIINVGFLFNKPFIPFGEYKFSSHLFNGIQTRLPFLGPVPVPVPFPYMEGLDLTYYYGEEGLAYGNIYLLGELRDGKAGFKGYYLIASLFKTPIATQIIILATFIIYLTHKKYRLRFFSDEIFLLLPIFFFTIYFNFLFRINIGIRYYLVLFPLLFVFCGSLFTDWAQFSKLQKNSSAALIAYLILSSLSYYPNFIPYFNELILDRKQSYKILADSNLDWGQNEYILQGFLAANPGAIHNPGKPTSGLIVASVNDLVGVFGSAQNYAWLRENFEPDDTLAYTYLIYNISPKEIETLCRTTEYCK